MGKLQRSRNAFEDLARLRLVANGIKGGDQFVAPGMPF